MSEIRFRKNPFVRGMCHCVWHDIEGWNLSEQTRKIDDENFEELRINSFRNWGDASDEVLLSLAKEGFTLAPTMINGVSGSCYKDGTPSGNLWAVEREVKAFAERIERLADIKNTDFIETYLLGNEQSMRGRDSSANMGYSGYDSETLAVFRDKWLPERFGEIEVFNAKCNAQYSSFEEVEPEANERIGLEFWLFLRDSFEKCLKAGVDRVHELDSNIKFGYARLMSRANPTCDDSHCDYMETATQNLYWHWWRDFSRYSARLDELGAPSDRPIYITEVGFMGLFSDETERIAARRHKQLLPLLYMRPQCQGSYIFCYAGQLPVHDPKVGEYTWGMCWPDRTKKPAFYAVKKVYSDFESLDKKLGMFYSVKLAAITNGLADELLTEIYDSDKIAKVLYSKGVALQFVRSDSPKDFAALEVNRLIYNDLYCYSTPKLEDNEAEAVAEYLNRIPGAEAITLIGSDFKSLYGAPTDGLKDIKRFATDKNDPNAVWRALALFIHGDFIAGNSNTESGADVIRVLDTLASKRYQTYDVQMQIIYYGNHAVLCVVNTGNEVIETLDVTVGIAGGRKLAPELICADGEVAIEATKAVDPSWIDGEIAVKIEGLRMENLDTYAFVKLM